MKQFTLIVLICIYGISSFGVGIKQFYCCGKLKSTTISFVEAQNEKCKKGNIIGDCCKTQFKTFKIKDSYIPAEGFSTPCKDFTDLHLYTPSIEITEFASVRRTLSNACHAPPLHHGIPIYILHCVYRI